MRVGVHLPHAWLLQAAVSGDSAERGSGTHQFSVCCPGPRFFTSAGRAPPFLRPVYRPARCVGHHRPLLSPLLFLPDYLTHPTKVTWIATTSMIQQRRLGWSLQSSCWPRGGAPAAAVAAALALFFLISNTLIFSTSSSALTVPATEKLSGPQADKHSSCVGFGYEACRLRSRSSQIFDNNNNNNNGTVLIDDDDHYYYCLNLTTTTATTTVTTAERKTTTVITTEPNANRSTNLTSYLCKVRLNFA